MLEQVRSLTIKICASLTPIVNFESGMKSGIEANCQRKNKKLVYYLK